MPRTVARRAVRSYRTLSPLPAPEVDVRGLGGLLSAALSVGLRRPGVTWHSALWSPDFPPLNRSCEPLSGDCLANSGGKHTSALRSPQC